MKAFSFSVVLLLFSGLSGSCFAQGYLKSDYLFSSSLTNKEGDKFGKSDLLKISGRYTLPFSIKQNDSGQVSAWSATLSGSYGISVNKDISVDIIPDEIVNLNLSLSHIRPLSQKWYLIASLGGGIYSRPTAVSAKSILVNGGVFFVYRLLNDLDVGIGAGVTTSYGMPMIMPMSYVKYTLTGKYELIFEAANNMQIAASAKFNDNFKMKLVAMEMDGMSAVMDIDNRSMIYSSVTMRSYLTPEYKIGKSLTLYLGIGGAWMRSVKISERSLKYFWETFKKEEDDNRFRFKPAGYVTVGVRYGF